MKPAQYLNRLVASLRLKKHPEGGWYREVYRSPENILPRGSFRRFCSPRSVCTSIYFLLGRGDFSAFHRLRSDEIWHFYEGSNLRLHLLHPKRGYRCLSLGERVGRQRQRQALIPAGTWFAAELSAGGRFALLGCTVAPGFDFRDFEMARPEQLEKNFPRHRALVRRLCRLPTTGKGSA